MGDIFDTVEKELHHENVTKSLYAIDALKKITLSIEMSLKEIKALIVGHNNTSSIHLPNMIAGHMENMKKMMDKPTKPQKAIEWTFKINRDEEDKITTVEAIQK